MSNFIPRPCACQVQFRSLVRKTIALRISNRRISFQVDYNLTSEDASISIQRSHLSEAPECAGQSPQSNRDIIQDKKPLGISQAMPELSPQLLGLQHRPAFTNSACSFAQAKDPSCQSNAIIEDNPTLKISQRVDSNLPQSDAFHASQIAFLDPEAQECPSQCAQSDSDVIKDEKPLRISQAMPEVSSQTPTLKRRPALPKSAHSLVQTKDPNFQSSSIIKDKRSLRIGQAQPGVSPHDQ